MNGKDLERYIEANSPLGATSLDHLGRHLRETGFLPTGGRGTSAPELTAQQVATYLLAAAVADKPSDGAEAVTTHKPAADVKPTTDVAVYNQITPTADETGKPLPTVRMTVRRLTDDGLYPKATGRRVPLISHEHAAMLLIAVMASPAVKDSSRTVMSFGAMVHDGRGKRTALEAVTRLLRSLPTDAMAFDWSMDVCVNPPQIVLKNSTIHAKHPSASERTDYGDLYIPAGDDWAHWPPGSVKLMKDFTILPGITLDAIARALVVDE